MTKIDSWYDQVPEISTENLTLRPYVESDLSAIKEIYEDTSLYRFFGRNKNTIERNPGYLFDPEVYDARTVGILRWGITRTGENKVIGEIMLYDIEEDYKCRIGCRIVKTEQNRGIATEATKGIANFFYHQDVFAILEADVMKGNKASYRALNNSGFVRTGKIRKGRYYIYQFKYPEKL